MGPPFLQCFADLCWTDHKGSGSMIGEPLAGYITPDTNITIIDSSDSPSALTGDIVLFTADHIPHLESAVLGTTTFPRLDGFKRYITDKNGADIGYMVMERPVPDPDTIFKDLSQDSLLAAIPARLRSEVNPASLIPSSTGDCKTSPTRCVLVIPSADVFYFGPEPTNTACLPAITSPPPSPSPPKVSMDPSSVYVVYQPAQIFDGCRNWVAGVVGPPVTMSYPSNVLSTLGHQYDAPPATKAFDYADLPCPPSNVAQAYDPRAPYFPILVSSFGVKFNLALDIGTNRLVGDRKCEVAAVIDPPVNAVRVTEITGPEEEGGLFI
ncbi:MAG: hypothetical protein Q9171_007056 [Xanthocarpia ochracea]